MSLVTLQNNGQPYVVEHQTSTKEDSFAQTATLETQDLSDYEHVFISMWAVNKVSHTFTY